MSVLIRSGRKFCNATCYNATTPADKCKCICNGANHGVGKEEAIRRTEAFARVQREEATEIINNCLKACMDSTYKQQNVFGGTNKGVLL